MKENRQEAEFPKETNLQGEFVRQQSIFRRWVTADGSSGFPAQSERYHLYVSLACPWAHRAIIFRKLKKLENVISLSIVDPIRDDRGWRFTDSPGCIPDFPNDFQFLSEAYEMTDPSFNGRVTVPVLWDKEKKMVVNNESSDIIRMFNSEFNALTDSELDYYPTNRHEEIDSLNNLIYHNINNGVYKTGFATTQEAYETAFTDLFNTLEELDEMLGKHRFLIGNQITETDWRLFPTLVRFDAVYFGHFKCNKKQIIDYPNLWGYTRDLYQFPGIAETVNMDHIKRHYYITHNSINPTTIVPLGPEIDFNIPHNRESFH